jgi:Golgi phosphoprotein 3 (GPP34)
MRATGVVVAAASPTGQTLLDEVLAEVRGEQPPRTIKWWVRRLAARHRGRKPVRDRLIDQLTQQGVLTRGERRVLGLVPVATHPVADPATAEQARVAVGEVLLGRQEPDEHDAALVALVQVAGLVDACVPAAERRPARRRAEQIAAGDAVGEAVKRIQQEMMAAVTAAVIASSAAASSGGNAAS